MKFFLAVFGFYASLLSCTDSKSNPKLSEENANSINTSKQPIVDSNVKIVKDTTQKPQTNNDLAGKLLGTWALVGLENATFFIEKKEINYPETFTSYGYSLVDDSIKIKYDDYTGSYLVKFKGSDTLILRGDEEQIYYRFKD